jgi:hypothetical protein
MSLTHGAVRTLATADQADPSYQPVLQVIHVKAVGGGGASERFRVSRTHHHSFGRVSIFLEAYFEYMNMHF